MKELLTPVRVGLLAISGLVSSVWMFGQVREGIGDDPSGYHVYAVFDDVSGLSAKSRVVIAGITIGQIEQIELLGTRAKVTLLVNVPLKDDARVSKRSASLLGEYYLQLNPGVTGVPLEDGDEIKNIDLPPEPANIMAEMQTIAENVREITDSLKRVVADDKGEQKLEQILDNVDKTVAGIERIVNSNDRKVDQVVENVVQISNDIRRFVVTFRRDADKIMKDAREVSEGAKVIVKDVRRVVGRDESGKGGIKSAVDNLEGALAKLDDTLESTRSITKKIDDGQGTIGRLVNDDKLINNVDELVDEAGGFVKQITRLQTIVSIRSEFYLAQGALKNYIGVKLQPRKNKYYLFQIVDDPRGKTNFVQRVTQTSDSNEDPVIREQQTITEDSFRLSLQFARRFFFFTGRIGLIENTGGVGFDLHFFDDNLQISSDIFAFDENINPRVKLWANYTFFSHVYIAAGVDEIWNEELTDFFVGLGLQFNDEDLKALMTATPSI